MALFFFRAVVVNRAVMAENPEREPTPARRGAPASCCAATRAQIRRRPAMAAGALLLPAVGDVLTLYAPPLVVARLLGAFADERAADARRAAAVRARVRGLWVSAARSSGASPSR